MPIVASGREARGDRDDRPTSIVDELDAACRRGAHAAPRARRSSTSRSTCSVRRRVEIPTVDRPRSAARRPIPTPSQRGRRRSSPRPSARCSSPAATCTGRTPKARCVAFAEAARVPVFVNGMGRGTLPADHELAFSRARSVALKEADLVLVAGTPLDFRLGFGRFGDAQVVHLCDAPTEVARARRPRGVDRRATSRATFAALADAGAPPGAHDDWIAQLRDDEQREARGRGRRARADDARRSSRRASTASCGKRLDRDAIVIGDGGDFVSYAGKLVDSYEPGTFLDPGPYGCLGMGPGLRARGRRSRIPTARSCCCSATARSASRSATSRRWSATASTSSRSSATTASGASRSTRCRRCSATTSSPSCARASATTRWSRRSAATASSCATPDEIGPALDRAFATKGVVARERAHRPRRRLPAVEQPRLSAAPSAQRSSVRALGADAERARAALALVRTRARAARAAMRSTIVDARRP